MDKIEKSEAIVDERETAQTRLSPPHRKSPAPGAGGAILRAGVVFLSGIQSWPPGV
jgi:hypothetical protein